MRPIIIDQIYNENRDKRLVCLYKLLLAFFKLGNFRLAKVGLWAASKFRLLRNGFRSGEIALATILFLVFDPDLCHLF